MNKDLFGIILGPKVNPVTALTSNNLTNDIVEETVVERQRRCRKEDVPGKIMDGINLQALY